MVIKVNEKKKKKDYQTSLGFNMIIKVIKILTIK